MTTHCILHSINLKQLWVYLIYKIEAGIVAAGLYKLIKFSLQSETLTGLNSPGEFPSHRS
jgi:hypothetical protein